MTQHTQQTSTRGPLEAEISSASIRGAVLIQVAVGLALVALDYTVNYREWVEAPSIQRLFNIAREDSLSAWLSSVQTLFVAGVVWLIYLHERREHPSRWVRRGWLVVALLFTYLAIDDGASIHERVGTAVEDWDGGALAALFPSYTWQPVFLPIFGSLGLVMLAVVWHELRRPLFVLFAAGMAMYVLAVGLDFAEGLEGVLVDDARHFQKVLEELSEMLGTALLFGAFAGHLTAIASRLEFRLPGNDSDGAAAPRGRGRRPPRA